MRFLLIFILALPVSAAEFQEKKDGSVVITLSKQEMVECAKKGGCVIISISDVQEVAKNAAAHMCGKSI